MRYSHIDRKWRTNTHNQMKWNVMKLNKNFICANDNNHDKTKRIASLHFWLWLFFLIDCIRNFFFAPYLCGKRYIILPISVHHSLWFAHSTERGTPFDEINRIFLSCYYHITYTVVVMWRSSIACHRRCECSFLLLLFLLLLSTLFLWHFEKYIFADCIVTYDLFAAFFFFASLFLF